MNFFEIINHRIIISNPNILKPAAKVVIKRWNGYGWGDIGATDSGYSFSQFLADAYHCLGDELSRLSGMQQLIHHYYLKIGDMDAPTVAQRIKNLIGKE